MYQYIPVSVCMQAISDRAGERKKKKKEHQAAEKRTTLAADNQIEIRELKTQ